VMLSFTSFYGVDGRLVHVILTVERGADTMLQKKKFFFFFFFASIVACFTFWCNIAF
jgi:hypothetical protein